MGDPIPISAIANKTPTKIINIYPTWLKYETTDVVPMQRSTATYTWAVVGGELTAPVVCMAISADSTQRCRN